MFHNRLQKQITDLEEELKNTREDLESLAQEREETIDQYEERILELEDEVSKLGKDHEEELQQVMNDVYVTLKQRRELYQS